MKIRQGFVSNSSSSSFICTVCGNVESGYDVSPADLEFARCENGHVFCQDHLIGDTSEINYNRVPEENCPICKMHDVELDSITDYALKKLKMTSKEVEAEIKAKFSNLEEFESFLRN